MMAFAVPARPGIPVKAAIFGTSLEITIDDGHFGDYADHLAGQYPQAGRFPKSKGWIKGYYILANVNKRAGEPDLYLVTIFDHVTTPAEDIAREKEINAYLAQTTRQRSGERRAGDVPPSRRRHASPGTRLPEVTRSAGRRRCAAPPLSP